MFKARMKNIDTSKIVYLIRILIKYDVRRVLQRLVQINNLYKSLDRYIRDFFELQNTKSWKGRFCVVFINYPDIKKRREHLNRKSHQAIIKCGFDNRQQQNKSVQRVSRAFFCVRWAENMSCSYYRRTETLL